MGKEEGTVTLKDDVKVEEVEVTEESMKDEGFLEEEIALAKQHGIIQENKEDEHDGESGDEGIKDTKKKDVEQKEGSLRVEDLDTFEKVHEIYEKQPDKFRDLPKNIKALYHNSKGLYKRAKIEEQKRSDLERKIEFDALKNKAAEIKLKKVQDVLKQEKITVEDIEAIIGNKEQEQSEVKDKSEDKETVQRRQAEFIQSRIAEADKLGRTEYPDFENIVTLAQTVVSNKPRQLKLLQDALSDETVSEKELVDMVVDIARLHQDFGKKSEKKEEFVEAEPTDEKVGRMIKNSQKKPTSASLGSGSGTRTKSYSELTPEDVAKMDFNEYKKLPEAVRRRLKESL